MTNSRQKKAAVQEGKSDMKSTEIREGVRFRNHISIILEQTGAVIAAIIVIVITQLV